MALIDAINFFRSAARPLDELEFIDALSEAPITVYDTLNVGAANFIQEAAITVTDYLILPGAFFLSDIKTIRAQIAMGISHMAVGLHTEVLSLLLQIRELW